MGEMDMPDEQTNKVILSGLDGANPLAFLAALGTLRTLTMAWPDRGIKMAWRQAGGAWRPKLTGEALSVVEIVPTLLEQCRATRSHPTLNVADNLNIDWKTFRDHVSVQVQSPERESTSFIAAFGCEIVHDEKGIIADTSLRTMSGAGHQHFLKTMREVLEKVSGEQIQKALFEPWTYDDPLKGLSLRFDPMDEKKYALQWGDPSGDPSRNRRGNMLGANALSVLGIPLLKVAPVRGRIYTTGFRGRFSHDCFWTWPIWTTLIGCDVVGAVLGFPELQKDRVDRNRLQPRGIAEVYRCRRVTTGKFRSFTPSEPV